jgi:hypothetical protein
MSAKRQIGLFGKSAIFKHVCGESVGEERNLCSLGQLGGFALRET